ncbi:MAG: hypothetical protein EOP53_16990, partial [Sphingobacteriales bacterium]
MIKKIFITVFVFCACTLQAQQVDFKKVIADAENQSTVMLKEIADAKKAPGNASLVSPRSLDKGNLK